MIEFPVVEIPDSQWEEVGEEEPWHRLLATIILNGTFMHVEALAVYTAEGDVQTSYFDDERYGQINDALDPGVWQTTEIKGREYVVIVAPHQ